MLIQWNCNGARARYNEINQLIFEYNPDIICLSETFLNPKAPYNCRGYTCLRKDRDPPGKGGGLITLIKNNIGARIINIPNNYDREHLVTEIVINNKTITIVSIYDNNGHGNVKCLENLINSITGTKIVVGD